MIQIEVSRDAVIAKRSVYTLFTLLADVGGLNGTIVIFAAFFSSIFTFNKAENYLAKKLYNQKRAQDLVPWKFDMEAPSSVADWLRDTLPSFSLSLCFCCFLPSRDERLRRRARDSLTKEMDVVRILRHLRFVRHLSRALLTQEEEQELERESRMITLWDGSDDDSGLFAKRHEQSNVSHTPGKKGSMSDSTFTNIGPPALQQQQSQYVMELEEISDIEGEPPKRPKKGRKI